MENHALTIQNALKTLIELTWVFKPRKADICHSAQYDKNPFFIVQ